jgi:DNA invertase Pin-like site-specific DNA recombinase
VPLADRAEGASLLAALKPGDVVITAKLDRMFRSASNALDVLESMKAKGIALHMIDLGGDVTGNGISKLVFTILSAVAESERDRIRERVASVKADQRQRGRYLGGKVPFGYIVGAEGTLQEVPEQQAALTTARAMRSSRAKLRVIREALIEQHGVTLCIASVANITESAA